MNGALVAALKKIGILEDIGVARKEHPVRDAFVFVSLVATVMFLSVGQRPVSWIVIAIAAFLTIPMAVIRRKRNNAPSGE